MLKAIWPMVFTLIFVGCIEPHRVGPDHPGQYHGSGECGVNLDPTNPGLHWDRQEQWIPYNPNPTTPPPAMCWDGFQWSPCQPATNPTPQPSIPLPSPSGGGGPFPGTDPSDPFAICPLIQSAVIDEGSSDREKLMDDFNLEAFSIVPDGNSFRVGATVDVSFGSDGRLNWADTVQIKFHALPGWDVADKIATSDRVWLFESVAQSADGQEFRELTIEGSLADVIVALGEAGVTQVVHGPYYAKFDPSTKRVDASIGLAGGLKLSRSLQVPTGDE